MKVMKRSLSVVLAFLMIFGSMSILASAALNDGTRSTISYDTKFYRYNGSEWVETTKAARGESIKVRAFLKTDFVLGTGNSFWLFSKKNIKINTTVYASGGA